MKKTVLALAAIAASSAAFAQSSVTLYGVVDASFESIKGDKSYTRVSSDNLNTTRVGFKGTEDLGGGLKANFNLEAAVKSDTGAFGDTGRAFNRAAWVGVSSVDAGELRIGRQDSLIGGLVAGTIGAQGYDESVVAQTLAGVAYRRLDNALTYSAPAFVPGLSLSAQYSTAANPSSTTSANGAAPAGGNAESTKGSKQGRSFGFAANFVQGPIGAGLAYISANATADGKTDQTGLYVYGSYDFGLAKLTAYFDQDKQDGAFDKRKVYGAKVAVPVATNFVVTAGYAAVKGADASGVGSYTFNAQNTAKDSSKVATLVAQYNLSKRTAVYSRFTEVWNDDNAGLKVSDVNAPANGKGSRGLAVGISHAF